MTRNEFAAMVDMVELSPSTPLSTVDALIADACENLFTPWLALIAITPM